ncbi:MAG: CHC2 zinc finger domain-containing protein [Clostridium sp.]|nr:CHC2 zinc finger domain-containing protein [Clostridium sp.]
MARIDQMTVQRILDTADIVDVVGEFVTLRRRGSNYMGLCPFHNERTPSFSVSKARGICKCFSCGKGGNVVNFLMEIMQISYGEALRWLAKRYGIEIVEKELTEEERQFQIRREGLQSVVRLAAENAATIYNGDEGRTIRATMLSAGITPAVTAAFNVGLTPNPAGFIALAKSRGFSDSIISGAGFSDTVPAAGQILLPATSRYGKEIALCCWDPATPGDFATFGPETIFKADDELIGIAQARREAAKSGVMVVTTIPADLLLLASSGVTNAVALPTPGFSERRIETIRRFAREVVLLLPRPMFWDAYRTMESANALLRAGVSVRVAPVPPNMTAAEFAAASDSDTVAATAGDSAVDIVSYKLANLTRAAGRAANAAAVRYMRADLTATLASVTDAILREIYESTVAEALGISVDQLRHETRGSNPPL